MDLVLRPFLLLFCLLTLMACSSTGAGRLSSPIPFSPATPKIVSLRPSHEERAVELMPGLTDALKRAGFAVTAGGGAPYEVGVTFAGGGFDLSCSIVLYEKGVPVVSGKGVNPGWGVWIARSSAYRGVFAAALREVSQRL